tara:strand:+ start:2285 stop:2473 length:189 start_codon:yes stop_codon:yes gene_type:complete
MMDDKELYDSNPRDFALKMVEDGLVDHTDLLIALLKYMSHDDVRGALDANELSPRFLEEEIE